ncbi:MAG: GldG family protein [Candidatus Acidiferrales bacterium]
MKLERKELARFLWTLAAAMLIAGYLRYSIQGELLRFSKILLIAGGVLTVVAVVLGFRYILEFFSKRSSKLGTNTAILAVAVIAILALLNFAGLRHHKRFDLTNEKLFTLSDQSKKVVGGLQNDITIVRFAKSSDTPLDDLMSEYTNLSRHLQFKNVDPQEKPDVAKQYGATHTGDVIASSGSRTEHIESGTRGQISEEDVTTALLKLTRDKSKTVCFVTGHGEKSITDSSGTGYSAADQGLKKETYSDKSVNLVSENGVPSDCDVLVIAGPAQSYFPQETAMISKYLDAGGKALIEVDPETDPKLDAVFKAWNIAVGNNIVIDASGMGRLIGAGPGIPLVTEYGASPITKGFDGSMTFFPLARTVSIAEKSKSDPQAVELLKTSPRSFTTASLKSKEIKFDPKTDTLGPLSLGVAADRKTGDKSARVVVIGDSDFAANQAINQARNGDLFYNTIDWLAQDESLISIRPKSAANRRVTMTEAQSAALKWIDLVFLPGIVILSGVYIWWKRR